MLTLSPPTTVSCSLGTCPTPEPRVYTPNFFFPAGGEGRHLAAAGGATRAVVRRPHARLRAEAQVLELHLLVGHAQARHLVVGPHHPKPGRVPVSYTHLTLPTKA